MNNPEEDNELAEIRWLTEGEDVPESEDLGFPWMQPPLTNGRPLEKGGNNLFPSFDVYD